MERNSRRGSRYFYGTIKFQQKVTLACENYQDQVEFCSFLLSLWFHKKFYFRISKFIQLMQKYISCNVCV